MVSPLSVRWTPCNLTQQLIYVFLQKVTTSIFYFQSSFHNLTHLRQLILILLWARLYFKRNVLWVLILWDSLKFAQVIFQTNPSRFFLIDSEKCFEGARQMFPLNIDCGGGGGGQTHLAGLFVSILCSLWDRRLACFFLHLLCLCVWYIPIYVDLVSSQRACVWNPSVSCKNPPIANKAIPHLQKRKMHNL